MKLVRINKLVVAVLFLTFTSILQAQFGANGITGARGMGMAQTSNAVSWGVNSIGLNPANLMKMNKYSLDFATVLPLPRVNVRTGTDFISIDEINYFFGGVDGEARFLTESDKDRLSNLFADGGLLTSGVSFSLFAFSFRPNPSFGAVGFSITDVIATRVNFPQAIVDLALNGNPRGKVYDLSDAEAKASWIRNYSFSYARKLLNFGSASEAGIFAGITLKIVQGFSYFGTEEVQTTFQTEDGNKLTGSSNVRSLAAFSEDFGVKYKFDPEDKESDFSPFPTPAGSGFGFDLGFNALLKNGMNVSFAITDIGSITWDTHIAQFSSSGEILIDDLTDEAQRDTLKDRFLGDPQPTESFSTSLPTALRLGVSHQFAKYKRSFPGSLLLSADFNFGFNDEPGNSTKPRLSIGAEWKPMDWIPFIRTGFSVGGLAGFGWAFGLGIDTGILEFNIATSDLQSTLAPNSAKYISVAIDSRWKF